MGAAASLPWIVVAVTIPVTFDWGRIGPVASMITVTSVYLTVRMGATTQTINVALDHEGRAAAVFVPTSVPGLCGSPTELSAFIVGGLTIPA
jgi:TctA family transporter